MYCGDVSPFLPGSINPHCWRISLNLQTNSGKRKMPQFLANFSVHTLLNTLQKKKKRVVATWSWSFFKKNGYCCFFLMSRRIARLTLKMYFILWMHTGETEINYIFFIEIFPKILLFGVFFLFGLWYVLGFLRGLVVYKETFI